MKILGELAVGLNDGSPELVQELIRIYPSGRTHTSGPGPAPIQEYFKCELPEGDPTLEKLLEAIKAHGYQLWCGKSRSTDKDIQLEYRRIYETSDFEAAELLVPSPEPYIGTMSRNPEGFVLLDPAPEWMQNARKSRYPGWYSINPKPKSGKKGLKGFEIGFTVNTSILVSDALRNKFEASGLKRLVFKPIFLEESNEPVDGYWELTSDFILPPLANPELNEGFYSPSEYHYRNSEIKSCEPFDLGLQREHYLTYPNPIASQRFYRFCVEQKLDMDWQPVRIDPD